MYRHCIKYFCLAQLESVLANLTVMLIDLRLKPILYFIYLLFLTLSVSSFSEKFYLLRLRRYFQSACAVLAGPKNKIFLVVLVIHFYFQTHWKKSGTGSFIRDGMVTLMHALLKSFR